MSPQEARALAQASLDSPALFDELTGAALAKAAIESAHGGQRESNPRLAQDRGRRRRPGGGRRFVLIRYPSHHPGGYPTSSRCWSYPPMRGSLCCSQAVCTRRTHWPFAAANLTAARRKPRRSIVSMKTERESGSRLVGRAGKGTRAPGISRVPTTVGRLQATAFFASAPVPV